MVTVPGKLSMVEYLTSGNLKISLLSSSGIKDCPKSVLSILKQFKITLATLCSIEVCWFSNSLSIRIVTTRSKVLIKPSTITTSSVSIFLGSISSSNCCLKTDEAFCRTKSLAFSKTYMSITLADEKASLTAAVVLPIVPCLLLNVFPIEIKSSRVTTLSCLLKV